MDKFTLPNLFFHTGGDYKKKSKRFPKQLPFVLYYDSNQDLIIQETNKRLKKILKLYYSLGGYGSTPLGEGEYAREQADVIFQLIRQSLYNNQLDIKKMSFLEIGAGYGYLLYLLKQAGAKEALGLEPGKEGIIGSKKYHLSIIQDFFPSKLLTKKFDYIFNHAVLEHIQNPLYILKEINKNLNDSGMAFIAVPDCEKKLEIGDISIISHQHLNYFTKNSLQKLMKKASFNNIEVVNSKQRSILFGYGLKGNTTQKKNDKDYQETTSSDKVIFQKFKDNLQKNITTIQTLVKTYEQKNKTIGLYASCTNLRGLIQFTKEPRIFEADTIKRGKYMPGSSNPFESPEQLVKNPVDILFITPIDYDQEIQESLKRLGLNKQKTKLISLKKIYEKNSRVIYSTSSTSSK